MKNETRVTQQEQAAERHDVGARYDMMVSNSTHSEYYEHSDFLNYGYWDETTSSQREASEKLVERLLSFLPQKNGSILDVACGKGASSRYLMRYFDQDQITGINISQKQLSRASQNAPGCSFIEMCATDLQFQDNSFDNLLCVEAAFHFDTREDFLKEAYRTLKPGGNLILSDILMHQNAERLRKYRHEENYLANPQEYEELLKKCGFINIEIQDATVECWKNHFMSVTRFFHEKFLANEITLIELQESMHLSYKRVPDTLFYLLVHATKP